MRVRRLLIRNFRSVRDATVDLGVQTALLGPNGAGKSTILRALDRFYGQSTLMEPDDFYGRNFNEPIELGLTFDSFSAWEKEQFASRIQNDEMTVVRVFEVGAKQTGRYYGMSLQHAPFQAVHNADGAVAKRQAYNDIRNQGGIYGDLAPATTAPQVADGIGQWEAAHPELCEPIRDDGQFFGFTNVAKGVLSKASTLVFIPAIRDVVADATDSKGAVVAQLIELLVRSAIQQRDDIQRWQVETSERYRELTHPENLTELGDLSGQLSETLKMFYRDAAVELQWKPTGDLTIPLPSADVLLDDDGFEGPVDRKGHGLQRALILTLLQHLAVAVSSNAHGNDGAAVPQEIGAEDAAAPMPQTPGLILAIEEPELYQHPTKQRHFAAVLTSLSNGTIPGVATNTQVVFASHSPLFVSMDRFDEIRLARRAMVEGQEFKECRLTSATLEAVARRIERAFSKREGSFTGEGLRSRLHIIDPVVAEGFFADLVVLVEGPGDRAAIQATASLLGIDLEGRGVAILPVGGKPNMDRPTVIFEELGIPTHLVWDCDGGDGNETNRALSRLIGLAEERLCEAETRIEANFACFEQRLEELLEQEIPALRECIDEVKNEFGIVRNDDVLKSSFAMNEVLKRAGARGQSSGTIEALVHAIAARV